jgi:hypothetical protein
VNKDEGLAAQTLIQRKQLHTYASEVFYWPSYRPLWFFQVVDAWREEFRSAFEAEYAGASSYIPQPQEWLASNWQGEALGGAGAKKNVVPTGLPMETLKHVVSWGPRQDRLVGAV